MSDDQSTRPSMGAPGPRYSPDGAWWWNGTDWVRAPQPPRTPMRPGVVVGIVVAVFAAFAVPAVIMAEQENNRVEQDYHDAYCERFGADNPDC